MFDCYSTYLPVNCSNSIVPMYLSRVLISVPLPRQTQEGGHEQISETTALYELEDFLGGHSAVGNIIMQTVTQVSEEIYTYCIEYFVVLTCGPRCYS